jgi:hypothetical protein
MMESWPSNDSKCGNLEALQFLGGEGRRSFIRIPGCVQMRRRRLLLTAVISEEEIHNSH